jgi:alpha-L-fucosidase
VGDWLQLNGESIYGTRGNVIPTQDWGTVTAKEKKLFIHILKAPSQDFILLPREAQKVASVQSYSSKRALKWKQQPEGILFTWMANHYPVDEIIEVTLK